MKRILLSCSLILCATPSFALNILLSNDDGLTSNLKALEVALTNAGHNVLVSVPCTNQSGRSAGLVVYSKDKLEATNDKEINKEGGCLNGVAKVGDPAFGPYKKAGYENYNYIHATPVVSVMYGIDVVAKNKWGKMPDLVISGPNEGQNVGSFNLYSGTIGIVQYAGSRGIPAIAFSAGMNTVANPGLNNPNSTIVANQAVRLVTEIQKNASQGKLLPSRTVLNVNFPDNVTPQTNFVFAKIGSFDEYTAKFDKDLSSGYTPITQATAAQQQDEVVVSKNKISVTAMQVAYDARPTTQEWLKLRLRHLFN